MNQARTIRLTVHVTKELNAVLRRAQQLATRKARDPSAEEIAAEVGKTVTKINRLLRLNERVTSADAPILAAGEITLQDTFAADNGHGPDNLLQISELSQRLNSWLHQLPERHREILSRRFGLNGYESETLENVGRAIGLTRERVRQIQIEALKKLKSIIGRDGVARDIFAEFN
jgi:RNA polymerase nonessential primary-like sigma factor